MAPPVVSRWGPPTITTGPLPPLQPSWGLLSRFGAASIPLVRRVANRIGPKRRGAWHSPSRNLAWMLWPSLDSGATATTGVSRKSRRRWASAAWPWLHGRSPISWSGTTHWWPSHCKIRSASNASRRPAGAASWPSMASNRSSLKILEKSEYFLRVI
jgi:hypothetical protein